MLGQERALCSSCSGAFHMGRVKAVHLWIERQPFMGVILVFPVLPDSAWVKKKDNLIQGANAAQSLWRLDLTTVCGIPYCATHRDEIAQGVCVPQTVLCIRAVMKNSCVRRQEHNCLRSHAHRLLAVAR